MVYYEVTAFALEEPVSRAWERERRAVVRWGSNRESLGREGKGTEWGKGEHRAGVGEIAVQIRYSASRSHT